MLAKSLILAFLLLAVTVLSAGVTGTQTEVVLQKGTPMEQITCAGGDGRALISKPNLPEGITIENGVISGTPVAGQNYREYIIMSGIRFEGVVVHLRIASMLAPIRF